MNEIFRSFLWLGLTSFGGPVAHLGFFRTEFVERRRWLDEPAYADIVALCQFLPGPASSQVAVSLGILRAGLPGGLLAWCGFTLPSAIVMILFAIGIDRSGDLGHANWLHGLKIVAVAVVAQAVWNMARILCPDRQRATLAVGAAVLVLVLPTALGQIGAIGVGALIGWRFMSVGPPRRLGDLGIRLNRFVALGAIGSFFILLAFLPLVAAASGNRALEIFAGFYRSGSLVFGGGHVVLPLLQQVVVPSGWISNDKFLAGYGAAQAVPGPLFSFAAYLGASMLGQPTGWLGGMICLAAIYLPSFLLLVGVLPFWDAIRRRPDIQSALMGVNAAVVGVLLAALYTPVWTSGITSPRDFGMGLVAFLLLVFWRTPPWLVVIIGAVLAMVTAAWT